MPGGGLGVYALSIEYLGFGGVFARVKGVFPGFCVTFSGFESLFNSFWVLPLPSLENPNLPPLDALAYD